MSRGGHLTSSGYTETTQASINSSSQLSIQNKSKMRGGHNEGAGPYGTTSQATVSTANNNRLPPQTADPYGSNKPAPIGS